MTASTEIDTTDRAILDLLLENGRRSVTEIAERVNLTPAPVTRRIARLEKLGVISGYTAIIDHSKLGAGFEAFVEIRFTGSTDVATIIGAATALPEVIEVFTVAGDPDALVRVRVSSVQHLQQVVDSFRRAGGVIGTKTLMVLGSWRRSS